MFKQNVKTQTVINCIVKTLIKNIVKYFTSNL